MSRPRRIQLRRTRGWRKPESAVVVARPSRWGNPFAIGDPHPGHGGPMTRDETIALFRAALEPGGDLAHLVDDAREHLAGRDLACWCPLVDEAGGPVPCHAEVWLEVANR